MFTCRKRQLQHHAGTVNKLTCGNIGGATDLGALNILPIWFNQQQFRGSAGQVPGKMRLIHQIQSAGAPKAGSHVPLLMGHLKHRHAKRIGKQLGVGIAHHKARHITALNGAGPCGNAYCRNFPHIGKEPAGKLRQAFDMRKYGIALS